MLRSKQIKLMMLVIALSLLVTCGLAANKLILINDEEVQFTSESGFPFIDSAERTQVPFRVALEKFGATVSFDSATRTAIAEKDGIKVEVPIGKKQILRNGVVIPVDTAGLIKDSKTYLPIRSVMEAFGCKVGWDSSKGAVSISFEEDKAVEDIVTETELTPKDQSFDPYTAFVNFEEKKYYLDRYITHPSLIIRNGDYYISIYTLNSLLAIDRRMVSFRQDDNPYITYVGRSLEFTNSDIEIVKKTEKVYHSANEVESTIYLVNKLKDIKCVISGKDSRVERYFRSFPPYNGNYYRLEDILKELEIEIDFDIEINHEDKTVTYIFND